MTSRIQEFERYLKKSLSLSVNPETWKDNKRLPFFLQDLYDFYKITLLSHPFLIMAAKDAQEQTPAILRKHFQSVKAKWNGEVIYLPQTVSSYNRKRLIGHKVPFVVPGTQM